MNKQNPLNATIGLRIKQSRKAAKLTQEQLAEKIEVSTQYISDLERGVVGTSIPTLIKICDCLCVSSDFLLRGIEPDNQLSLCLSSRFHNLTLQEQALMEEGFNLLNKAFSINS